jgi:hypothetical protein
MKYNSFGLVFLAYLSHPIKPTAWRGYARACAKRQPNLR